jgi:uncharacterized membrane protein
MQSQTASTSRDAGHSPAKGAALTRGLGFASLAIATAELVAPRAVASAIGLEPKFRTSAALRLLGLRELAVGMSILFQPRRPIPIWARVAGDVANLGLLAWAATGKRTKTERVAAAFLGLAGTTALDAFAARRTARLQHEAQPPVMFAVTIHRSPAVVYGFFRDFTRLPEFMTWLESVDERVDGSSRWVAKSPVGATVAWDADIVEEREDEVIAWRTRPGAPLQHAGRVTFARAPGRESTEVRVEMTAAFPGFSRGSVLLAKALAKPQIKGDLRRLKQVLETGEVVRS